MSIEFYNESFSYERRTIVGNIRLRVGYQTRIQCLSHEDFYLKKKKTMEKGKSQNKAKSKFLKQTNATKTKSKNVFLQKSKKKKYMYILNWDTRISTILFSNH